MNKPLWEATAQDFLTRAAELLQKDAAPTAATVETAGKLVEIAVNIELMVLRRDAQTRYGAAV